MLNDLARETYALFVRLLPMVFLAGLAWAVARSPYKTPGNRLLSAFFGLVALGFFLEFMAAFAEAVSGAPLPGLRVPILLLGVADPLVLLAFSLAFPAPRPALRSRALWLACGLLALVAVFAGLNARGAAQDWALQAYVDGLYIASFVVLLNAYLKERHRLQEQQSFFVVLGVGFAAFTRTAGLFFGRPPLFAPSEFAGIALGLPVGLLAMGACYASVGFTSRPLDRTRLNAVFGPLLAMTLGFTLLHYAILWLEGLPGRHFGSQYFGLRWLVVGGILGYGILHHQLFDFELRTRQAIVFVASLALGLLAASATTLLALDSGSEPAAAHSLGLAAGAILTLTAYVALVKAWNKLRPGQEMPPRYRKRRVEVYEAALEYALANEQWTLGEHLFADTLREVFQISPAEHDEVMRRLAARKSAGRRT